MSGMIINALDDNDDDDDDDDDNDEDENLWTNLRDTWIVFESVGPAW